MEQPIIILMISLHTMVYMEMAIFRILLLLVVVMNFYILVLA